MYFQIYPARKWLHVGYCTLSTLILVVSIFTSQQTLKSISRCIPQEIKSTFVDSPRFSGISHPCLNDRLIVFSDISYEEIIASLFSESIICPNFSGFPYSSLNKCSYLAWFQWDSLSMSEQMFQCISRYIVHLSSECTYLLFGLISQWFLITLWTSSVHKDYVAKLFCCYPTFVVAAVILLR